MLRFKCTTLIDQSWMHRPGTLNNTVICRLSSYTIRSVCSFGTVHQNVYCVLLWSVSLANESVQLSTTLRQDFDSRELHKLCHIKNVPSTVFYLTSSLDASKYSESHLCCTAISPTQLQLEGGTVEGRLLPSLVATLGLPSSLQIPVLTELKIAQ